MKIVKEHINEKFQESSDPVKDMDIGGIPYNYNNLFIAKQDVVYVANRKKIIVPKGTVLSAAGGGMFSNSSSRINIGNVDKINGKPVNWNYNIRDDKDNYEEVYYNVWEKFLDLKSEIDKWFRDDSKIEAAAKDLNIQKVYQEIEKQNEVVEKIRKLLQ